MQELYKFIYIWKVDQIMVIRFLEYIYYITTKLHKKKLYIIIIDINRVCLYYIIDICLLF